MYFKYRGFFPMLNGKETITIDGNDIKGKWIHGLVTGKIPNGDIYVKPEYSSHAYLCTKETINICVPCIHDVNGKEIYTGDIVDFYVEVRQKNLGGYTGTVSHTGKVIYNPELHEFMLDADLFYSLSEAKGITIIGQEFVNDDIELR